jgi:hypothetical protein
MRNGKTIAIAVIVAGVLAAAPAHATSLAPGGSVTTPNASFGPIAYGNSGTVLASFVNEAPTFSSTPSFTGTLTTEVIKESGGTLDFLYQITAATTNTTNIHRVTANDFTNALTNVQFGTAGFSFVAPTNSMMSGADRSSDGSTIGWSIVPAGSSGGVAPGEISQVLIVRTNAITFTTGNTFAIDGGIMSFNSFAPLQFVPEPSSLALAGIGVLGTIGYGLRRRKKAQGA